MFPFRKEDNICRKTLMDIFWVYYQVYTKVSIHMFLPVVFIFLPVVFILKTGYRFIAVAHGYMAGYFLSTVSVATEPSY